LLLLSGCTLIDWAREPRYSNHRIQLWNGSSDPFYVEVSAENRFLDTTGYQTVADFVIRDTSFIMQPHSNALLYTREYADFHRLPLDYSEIAGHFIKLKVYKITEGDTLPGNIDLLEESNWEYSNSDPLTFDTSINHYYLLLVEDEDFR
jgi:hypothetical protein